MRSHHLNRVFGCVFAAALAFATGAAATPASVLDATVSANEDGTYALDVTISHLDEGWTHYVDRFEVLAPDGKVLETRVIYHPHVDVQPFTRSLSRVAVPIGVTRLTIRAHDTVTGDGTRTFTVDLPPRK